MQQLKSELTRAAAAVTGGGADVTAHTAAVAFPLKCPVQRAQRRA